jgi:uncharacterized protein (TIGR02145 family)
MKKYLLAIITIYLALQIKAQTISDVDGNPYHTVTIGTQTWLKENLKTTKYNDNTSIPNITDKSAWKTLTTPAYCWYNNDTTYKYTTGALYNWYTVNACNLCPTGWHVPSENDWLVLTVFLGGDSIAGGKLKEAGFAHWASPNKGATNSSGFTALPNGYLYSLIGGFNGITTGAYWWSNTSIDETTAHKRMLDTDFSIIEDRGNDKHDPLGVRCLKDTDAPTSLISIIDSKYANSIYPNPAKDIIYVKNIKPFSTYVTISDFQGRQIVNMRMCSDYIDISELTGGVYIVIINNSGNITMQRLIKE